MSGAVSRLPLYALMAYTKETLPAHFNSVSSICFIGLMILENNKHTYFVLRFADRASQYIYLSI